MDILCDPELQGALHRLLHPPHKVVALLCGILEDDVLTECFEYWHSWRKIYADDDPAVYVDTILESFNESTEDFFLYVLYVFRCFTLFLSGYKYFPFI